MKKKLFFLLTSLCILFTTSIAQWTGTTDIYNTNTGNVGIGTTAPTWQLEVRNTSGASSGSHVSGYFYAEHNAATTGGVFGILGTSKMTHSSGTVALSIGISGTSYNSGSSTVSDMRGIAGNTVLNSSGNVTNAKALFGSIANVGTGTITNAYGLFIDAFSSSGITNKWGVYINDANAKNYFGGAVGIGTTAPGSFMLAVEGKIGGTEVHVTTHRPWPDYVFSKKYLLMSLENLDSYIQKNNHLPQMPSAADVRTNGIDLGDISSKLLQKVEELTLYVIELKKENSRIARELKRVTHKK